MLCYEFHRLGPQCGNGLRIIVQVDGKAISLVIILHVSEDIVVDVAEEVHFGLHSPIILRILKRRVLVEESAVPSTHLVV